jgi:hypothetical protein
MIYFPLTKIVDSSEAVTAPGANITAEGQALIRVTAAPANGVTVSAGAANEIFAGFAIMGTSAAPLPALYATKVETLLVPGSGIVQLAFTPVSGQLAVFDNTAGAAVSSPTVVGSTVTTLTAGNTVTVTYKYALTVVQARALQGDVQPGGYVGSYVGQIGVAKRGTIYTDQFDASVNWAAATGIKLAANGQITNQAGTGVALPGAYVVSLPTQEVPFLGLEFSAA